MDFSKNIKSGIGSFPLKKMRSHEKFLAVAAFVAKGTKDVVKVSEIRKRGIWNKELLGIKFSYKYYQEAIKKTWVEPSGKNGQFHITDEGYNHLHHLSGEINSKEIKKVGKLIIFNAKATNTFDSYIKVLLSSAKQRVLIVDSYISDVLFDDIFKKIPKDVSVKLLFGKIDDEITFGRKLKRFKTEWQKFNIKENKIIHDRFMIVDNTGYFLGPSIKDAADKSPCALIALNQDETALLSDFFKELWSEKNI